MEHTLVVDACRGQQACRGYMSWATILFGTCRGDNESMSWNTCMSWMYVVEHMLFPVNVVGTEVVCRGYQYVVDACRGEQSFSGACRGW